MNYQGYGGSNPYDQRDDNWYAQQQGGNSGPPPQGSGHGQSAGYEMSDLNGRGVSNNNPNQILEECRDIDRGIDIIDSKLKQLQDLQLRELGQTNPNSPIAKDIDNLMHDIENSYRDLIRRMKNIKSNPESGSPRNAPQVGRVDRRLKDAVQRNMQIRRDYEKECKARFERNYRIVRPQASDAEVREAAEVSNGQVFSQAMLQSDRRGQAQSALAAVQSRHAAIQKVENDIIALAELFQDLEQAVAIQEPMITQIEQKGEEVNDNVQKGNLELNSAVKSARAARKKKWMCLGLIVLIIIIIVIVVVVVVEVTGVGKKTTSG